MKLPVFSGSLRRKTKSGKFVVLYPETTMFNGWLPYAARDRKGNFWDASGWCYHHENGSHWRLPGYDLVRGWAFWRSVKSSIVPVEWPSA
jgi:hypothetical protein